MADEAETDTHDTPPARDQDAAPQELVYESNPKHSEPWQSGKKGSLCEPGIRELADQLLLQSVLHNEKRFAVHDGRAYCAQQHSPNHWHGYPVGWVEVPPKFRTPDLGGGHFCRFLIVDCEF